MREEPTVTSIDMDSKGRVSFKFADNMGWPESWKQKQQADAARRRMQEDIQFLEVSILNQTDGETTPLSADRILLLSLEPKQFKVKILFEDPGSLSMTEFTESDKLIIGFPKDLVLYNEQGRSVVLDDGDSSGESTINLEIPIQPQIEANAVHEIVNAMVCVLVPVTTSFMYFMIITNEIYSLNIMPTWSMMHSHQLIGYLPLLSMQLPPAVSQFYSHVVRLGNLEGHSLVMEPLFDFKWTLHQPSMESLDRFFII